MTEIVINDSFVEAERAKRAIRRYKEDDYTRAQIAEVAFNFIMGAIAWYGFTFLIFWADYGIGVAPINTMWHQVLVTVMFRAVSMFGVFTLGLGWWWYSVQPIYEDANELLSRVPLGVKKFLEAIERKDEL